MITLHICMKRSCWFLYIVQSHIYSCQTQLAACPHQQLFSFCLQSANVVFFKVFRDICDTNAVNQNCWSKTTVFSPIYNTSSQWQFFCHWPAVNDNFWRLVYGQMSLTSFLRLVYGQMSLTSFLRLVYGQMSLTTGQWQFENCHWPVNDDFSKGAPPHRVSRENVIDHWSMTIY